MATVLTLLSVGIVLVLVEFFLPGMIAGVIGIGCLMTGVIVSYVEYGAGVGSIVLTFVMVGLIVGTIIWIKYLPNSRIGEVFVSHGTVGEAGFDYQGLLDQEGKAQTSLNPSGIAVIGERRCDVVTEGFFAEAGTLLKVVNVEGNKVVVRPITTQD